MTVPDDFIETEIDRVLAILEKYCKTFGVDEKKPEVKVKPEGENQHVNG